MCKSKRYSKKEFIEELEKRKCEFKRRGKGDHEIWVHNPSGRTFTIVMGREQNYMISLRLLKEIDRINANE